jgi:class 3 adenylate cyclase
LLLYLSVSASISFDILKAEIDKYASIYDWGSATGSLESFLKANPTCGDERVFELLGDCFYKLAFQQNTRDDFKQVILRAKEAYEKATDDNRCKARASFSKYWASDDADERRRLIISECLPVARELVKQLSDSSGKNETILARSYVELLNYLTVACIVSSDRRQLVELVKEAKLAGRNAFIRFKSSSNPETVISVTESYAYFLEWATGIFLDSEEASQFKEDFLTFIEILLGLIERIQDTDCRIKSLAYETAGIITAECKGDLVEANSLFEKALTLAEKTNDRYIIARQFYLLGYSLYWAFQTTDIAERRKEIGEKVLNYCWRAFEISKVLLAPYELLIASYYYVQQSYFLSEEVVNREDKLRYLDKAIELGRTVLHYEQFAPTTQNFSLGNALGYKAELVPRKDERETLLAEAIGHLGDNLSHVVRLIDPQSWNLGVYYSYAGLAKSRLSEEKIDDIQERESLLKESASDFMRATDICAKSILSVTGGVGPRSRVARMFEDLGSTLVKLYDMCHRREDCLDAIKAYEEASRHYSEANLVGFVAPITWKIARLYDSISEYAKSSNAFIQAAQQYHTATANQKSLQKSFTELSSYMLAWSKIEDARLLHSKEKYELASERAKEASDILYNTEQFEHLGKHYLAFSKMEQAEGLSRKESNAEASISFMEADDLFEQAKIKIEGLAKIRTNEENELKEWARLSESRGKYCLARKELDEARVFDKNGEVQESMSKYRSAAESLKELKEAATQHQDKSEFDALALSCDAWATMKEAEYSASPELYAKASQLFMRAKDSKVSQSFVLSCLANSSICEAFEAGTKFKKSRDVSLYSEIKKKLGAASQYYEEAGFEIASDWTGATEALFDALAYLAAAEGEMDSTRKTQMYHLAEKHLELSARRYGDIGYDKKRQEVLKQLKKARENRELLITPMDALSQNPTVSSTPVNFTRDQAVGLERFEVANLTGNISISAESTNIGSSIKIDIDIANVGKTPALLMKLDNLASSNGFDIDMKSNSNNFQNLLVDGNSIALDLKGKRLEYLKSHEVSLHLIAKNRGNYQLKPRILFVDELGKYRSYEFEPQNIQVTSIERKLAAIMFTDMAGYTALGQRNELLSIALVNEQRKLLRPIFKRHNGREVKTIGDAFLVEFASSLDAARCAYDIQRATREFNISLPEDKRIILRVGVHIGDVIESDDGDITGDAVNVASRIEPLAEHGGVCLTRQVYDNIQNKFDLKLQSLGLKSLKNVSAPIEVFKMVMPWE